MQRVPQPTKTSCGPASIAAIVGRPIDEVMAIGKDVRQSKWRRKLGTDRMNVGEARRTLAVYGLNMLERHHGRPGACVALLRYAHPTVNGNWHWMAYANGKVYDPAMAGVQLSRLDITRLSFYPIALASTGQAVVSVEHVKPNGEEVRV